MPSKKKKYNARFPPARIKKIMQTDEEVGKVAAAVPVIISRALELFIDSLIERTASITKDKHAKTLSTSHVKQAIHSEKTFDFLRDLVKNVPDHQADEDDGGLIASGSGVTEPKPKQAKPRKIREPSDKTKENPTGKRGPGRPKKVQVAEVKKESSADEDTEETDTDEEQNTSEQEQGQPRNFRSPVGALPVPCISDNKQAVPNPFISPQGTGVTEVTGPYPGPVVTSQSDGKTSQTSSNLQYPGTNTLHQMQPAFQTPVQSYPMHNIPIPPYPYPMALPQGNMSQFNEFSPNPTFNGSNNSSQFIPPMIHPYMAPIVGMPQTGFMMPPPPQDGLPYMSMYGSIPGGSHSVPVSQTEAELHSPYSPQKVMSEPKNCEMPLDMTVGGKIRSQSIIEPPREDRFQTESNQKDTDRTSSPKGNRLQPEQGNVGGLSTEQKKESNGPAMEVNSKHRSKLRNMSPKKSAVKSSDSNTRSNSVEKNTVMKDKKRNKVDSSIEYHTLSSLMNKGPAKIVNNEDDDDYDT